MVGGTLYTYPDNFRAFKALIAAEYSGAKVTVAKDFVFGETNRSKEFLAKFPGGKVPAFQASDGTCLTESNAIAYFLANGSLRCSGDPVRSAQVIQWMQFADGEILPASSNWILPILGAMPHNRNQADRAKEEAKKALAVLNDHLLTRTYLVGEGMSLADVAVACTLLQLYQHVLEPGFRKPYVNANRWFTTVVNQPQVKKVIGEFKMCEKMAQFDPKKGDGGGGGAKKGKKEEKGGKNQPKKEEKKKQPEAAAAEDDDDDDIPKPEKQRDPFAEIPRGSFDLDDFKRFYSNNDEDKSVPYFWEKFDKEHYSIWRCDYKYNDELTMVFMSCNLIGGMFQRLEKLKKNAFASMCLFGENNDSSISGVWVWRGQGLAFDLTPDWQIDCASYDWKKLDADSAETKKLVDGYFKWDHANDEGRKFNQGKIFK